MINLKPELRERLENEQNAVIKSKEEKILVSAGPGSGKTYTLVKRIINELNSIDQFHGIIACSFTQLASKQLENKIKAEIDIKKSFIGTIDSFLIKEIFFPFKNRFIQFLGEEKEFHDMFNFTIPDMNSEADDITKKGFTSNYSQYLKKWKNNFCANKYEISFASYLVALELLDNIPEAEEYLKLRYTSIYIDEAQDLNEFQISFVEKIIEKCNWKCCLIGDKNQSIYEFRGAKPNLFYDLVKKGFTELKIDVSVRCHESILWFSNCFIDDKNINNQFKESRIYKLEKIDKKFFMDFNKLEGNKLVLFETNNEAKEFYKWTKQNHFKNYIYTQQLVIKDKNFSDNNLMIINEILYFFYNFNENGESCYNIDDFKLFLSTFIVEKKVRKVKIPSFIPSNSPLEYIKDIYSLMEIQIKEPILKELEVQLNNPSVINYYKRKTELNKIMTIHASKGLEANCVIVSFDCKSSKVTEEYKRKLYVSFTRAKNHLYIRCLNPTTSINKNIINKIGLIITFPTSKTI